MDARGDMYGVNQNADVASFLLDFGLDTVPFKVCPMQDMDVLMSDDRVLGPNGASWCKSALGVLNFLSRGVRWDISQAVSKICQMSDQ